MSPVAYLVIAVVVGLVGIAVLVSMNRAPRRPDFAMEEFRREMQALAPPRGSGSPDHAGSPDTPRLANEDSIIKRIGPETGPEER